MTSQHSQECLRRLEDWGAGQDPSKDDRANCVGNGSQFAGVISLERNTAQIGAAIQSKENATTATLPSVVNENL